jgi:hypothetical protein
MRASQYTSCLFPHVFPLNICMLSWASNLFFSTCQDTNCEARHLLLYTVYFEETYGTSYPIIGLERPLGLRRLRLPEHVYRQSAHGDGQVVSPRHRPPLTRRKYSWCLLMSEAESTSGPYCGRKDSVIEPIGNRTRDIPDCSTVPQPRRYYVPAFGTRPFWNPRSGWKNNRKMYIMRLKFVRRKFIWLMNTKRMRMLMLVALSLPVLGVVDGKFT